MDATEVLATFEEFERRAERLYRRFATICTGDPEQAALWTEMADIEAGHGAALGQVSALVRAHPDVAKMPPSLLPGSLAATHKIFQDAEAKAADGGLPAGHAVQIGLMLESSELPRIVDLLGWLPPRARGAVGEGIVAGFELHLRCLERLAGASGRADLAEKARALQAMARGIAQRHAAPPHP